MSENQKKTHSNPQIVISKLHADHLIEITKYTKTHHPKKASLVYEFNRQQDQCYKDFLNSILENYSSKKTFSDNLSENDKNNEVELNRDYAGQFLALIQIAFGDDKEMTEFYNARNDEFNSCITQSIKELENGFQKAGNDIAGEVNNNNPEI